MSGLSNEDRAAIKDLLLAELANFEAAIGRSEDTGEKRFNFFITLVTAVAAGLVALWSADDLKEAIEKALPTINLAASCVLLIFGFVTYLRMRHRDRVTLEFQDTTRHVRETFKKIFYSEPPPGMQDYKVPLGPKKSALEGKLEKTKWGLRLLKVLKGGYSVSLAVLNGIMLAITLYLACSERAIAIASGVLLAITLLAFIPVPPVDKSGKAS